MPLPLIPIFALASGYLALRERPLDGGAVVVSPNAESWRDLVGPLAVASGIDPDFAIQWIAIESDGNPCAFGRANALGPDGYPREMGLAQLYNPDDLASLGVSAAQLRAYCVTGSQRLARPLTETERLYQATAAVALMARCKARAERTLQSVGASWTSKDIHRLAKLYHALPGLASAVGRVTTRLGRPPGSWEEFSRVVVTTPLDAGTMTYSSDFDRLLGNAERTGKVVIA